MKTPHGPWRAAAALYLSLLASSAAVAQKLEGPLRLLVGFGAGGLSDRAARLLAERLQERHGISVSVDNQPGADGRLAAQQFKLSKPDEAVLMLGNPAVITIAPLIAADTRYDPEADFVPLSQILSYSFAVVAGAQVPADSLQQLAGWLREHPDQSAVGVPRLGSLPHFVALSLAERAALRLKIEDYPGSGPLVTEIIGGQLAIGLDTLEAALPLHKAGRLRILATTGARRAALAPDIPTLADTGIDLVAEGWNIVFAPRSMPPARAAAYAAAIQAAMADPALQMQFLAAGIQPVSRSQAETAALLKVFQAQWRPVIQRSGYAF